MGPRAGLDISEKRNLSYRDSKPEPPGLYHSRHTDYVVVGAEFDKF